MVKHSVPDQAVAEIRLLCVDARKYAPVYGDVIENNVLHFKVEEFYMAEIAVLVLDVFHDASEIPIE